MTVYGYARVSTAGQSLADQREQLRYAGAEKIFHEKFTGTTIRRPEFEKLLQQIKPYDRLIVTKLDRLARNTKEALEVIDQLLDENVTIQALNLGTIDNTPMGKMIVRTLLSVAEMERDMIVERTQAGKRFAKQHNPNYREGRPRRKKDARNTAIYEYTKTHTGRETAEAFQVSLRTVQYIKKMFKLSSL